MTSTPAPRDVVILGSTGSIGTQALDIVRRNPGRFRVAALAAGGGNPGLLAGTRPWASRVETCQSIIGWLGGELRCQRDARQ